MREFYREREAQLTLERVALNRAVGQVLELTRPRWSDLPQQRGIMVELRTDLEDSLPDIMGAEHEIRDALTNLIFNAVDAMPAGGTLALRTRKVTDADGTDRVLVDVGDLADLFPKIVVQVVAQRAPPGTPQQDFGLDVLLCLLAGSHPSMISRMGSSVYLLSQSR